MSAEDALRQAGALREAGRFAEAEAAYRAALAQAPGNAVAWYNLGWVQRRLGRFDAALDSYAEALKRGIGAPEEVHLNRAAIYTDALRRDDEAERELSAALKRNPRYVPALLNLGNLHEDRGARAQAAGHYEQALAIDPAHAEALARLAGVTQVASADDPIIARLEQAIARSAQPAERASLGFALGRALDAVGAYPRAFVAYAQANAESRASGAPRYDRAGFERLVDALIAAFPRAEPAGASEARAPLFICGMFRSGSTLTEQVLAAHPRVTAGGELPFLPWIAQRELAPFPASMPGVPPEKLAALAGAYIKNLGMMFPDAGIVTDKRPDNFLYVGLIKRLFPSAKIVHTTRNPLDNCLSIFFLHLDHSMSYALDLMDIGHHYRQYRRLMAHWQALYPADILAFDYDAFVCEPRANVERLLTFAGLEWDERCLAFHEVRNAVKTASVWQVREPLYQRASGRARNYETELRELKAYLEG